MIVKPEGPQPNGDYNKKVSKLDECQIRGFDMKATLRKKYVSSDISSRDIQILSPIPFDDIVATDGPGNFKTQAVNPFWAVLLAGRFTEHMVNMEVKHREIELPEVAVTRLESLSKTLCHIDH